MSTYYGKPNWPKFDQLLPPKELKVGDVIDLTEENGPLTERSRVYWLGVLGRLSVRKVKVVSIIHDSVELEPVL